MHDFSSSIQQELEIIIRDAGHLLMSYYGKPLERMMKNMSFATQADIAVEQFLIERLGRLMPQASFIAEESGKQGNADSDYSWVIDPLDGTTNFAQGLPYFCISVALTHKNEPIIAATYQPLLGEFFYAQRGAGTWLNGVRVYTGSKYKLLVVVASRAFHGKVGNFDYDSFVAKYGVTRYFGASALDCAYLACGKLDAVIKVNPRWWDVAAGVLLITEAGGLVTDAGNKPEGTNYKTLIGGSPEVHKLLLEYVSVKR